MIPLQASSLSPDSVVIFWGCKGTFFPPALFCRHILTLPAGARPNSRGLYHAVSPYRSLPVGVSIVSHREGGKIIRVSQVYLSIMESRQNSISAGGCRALLKSGNRASLEYYMITEFGSSGVLSSVRKVETTFSLSIIMARVTTAGKA